MADQDCSMKPNGRWINPFSDWPVHPEESANVLTHAVGLLLAILGGVLLVYRAAVDGDGWRVAACTVYTACLVAVYAMSTLSHSSVVPRRRHRFRKLDQACIYLLIVATYTPFSLAFLRTPAWWAFLAVMWTLALLGFLSKTLFSHRVDTVSIWIYVALGWMPIAAAPWLVGIVPAAGLWWMLGGGICYTVGTIFLAFDARVRHFHALWHLCVVAGSTCHFLVIWFFVAGKP